MYGNEWEGNEHITYTRGNRMSDKTSGATNESFVLKGKSFYLQGVRPNELSGKYQMDISLDDTEVQKLKAIGVEVKNKDDARGNFVTLKRSASTKDGTPMAGPKIIDSDEVEIPAEVLIGNGSTVKVVTHKYDWTFKGKKGIGLGLDVVQVLDLVPYENKSMSLLREAE